MDTRNHFLINRTEYLDEAKNKEASELDWRSRDEELLYKLNSLRIESLRKPSDSDGRGVCNFLRT